jgi:hypothetical protein
LPTNLFYGNTLAETTYRAGVIYEAERLCLASGFEGTDASCAVVVEDRPGGNAGETIHIRFSRPNQTDLPKTSTAPVFGQESSTEYLDTTITMRYGKLDGALPNVPAEQNEVSFDLVAGEISRVARQWAELKERWFFRQLTGFIGPAYSGGPAINIVPDFQASGGNPVVVTDSKHWLYAQPPSGAAISSEAGIYNGGSPITNAVLSTRLIDELQKRAGSRDYVQWPVAPCQTPWGEYYVFAVSPQGFQQIRQNSSVSDFYDLARADLMGGGDWDGNPLITAQGFIYADTIVVRSDFLPGGCDANGVPIANVKRAAFFGARCCHQTYGSGFTAGEHFGFVELKLKRYWSFDVDTIQGLNRVIVGQPGALENFGSFTVSHYSDV